MIKIGFFYKINYSMIVNAQRGRSLISTMVLLLGIVECRWFRYTWWHNGFPLDLNEDFVRPLTFGGDIEIRLETALAEGTYQCEARNQYGTSHTHARMCTGFNWGTVKYYRLEIGLHQYSPCNSPCVASPVRNSPPGGPGLSGLVHEEAHPCISYHT